MKRIVALLFVLAGFFGSVGTASAHEIDYGEGSGVDCWIASDGSDMVCITEDGEWVITYPEPGHIFVQDGYGRIKQVEYVPPPYTGPTNPQAPDDPNEDCPV